MIPVQDVFLSNPPAVVKGEELDSFCRNMIWEPGFDGVYCIAGDRGSGKSFLLERISRWIDEKSSGGAFRPRPLLVRLDLGTHFDSRRLTLDLIRTMCHAARDYCRRPPLNFDPSRFHFFPRFFANRVRNVLELGAWFAANSTWLFVLFAAATIYLWLFKPAEEDWKLTHLGATNLEETLVVHLPPITEEKPILEMMSLVTSNNTKWAVQGGPTLERVGQAEFRKLDAERWRLYAQFGFGLTAAGCIISLTARRKFNRRGHGFDPEKNWNSLFIWFIAFMFSGPVFLIGGSPFVIGSELRLTPGLVVLLVGIVLSLWLMTAIWFLPSWCRLYEYAMKMEGGLHAKNEQKLEVPENPVLAFIASLLPRSAHKQDLDITFLQRSLRELLNEISAHVPRIVVLVDDVDALPSSTFHELFRLLRPLSKVQNLRCIMGVPKYFYDELHCAVLSDLNSSVRDCYLVGNPDLLELSRGCDVSIETKCFSRGDLSNLMIPLLCSRLLIRLESTERNQIKPHDPKTWPEIFQRLLKPWGFEKDKMENPCSKKEDIFLRECGQSKREIIREIERAFTRREALAGFPEEEVDAQLRRYNKRKQLYARSERNLSCESVLDE